MNRKHIKLTYYMPSTSEEFIQTKLFNLHKNPKQASFITPFRNGKTEAGKCFIFIYGYIVQNMKLKYKYKQYRLPWPQVHVI